MAGNAADGANFDLRWGDFVRVKSNSPERPGHDGMVMASPDENGEVGLTFYYDRYGEAVRNARRQIAPAKASRHGTCPSSTSQRSSDERDRERQMVTNDTRELLIHAAKAAGIELDLITPCGGGFRAKQDGRWTSRWAPHLDDGDSRRLEVTLSMRVVIRDISSPDSTTEASMPTGERASVPHAGDPAAATRMAVLSAAAQYGMR